MNFTPLYGAMFAAGLVRPGYMFPFTMYCPHTYLRAGGVLQSLIDRRVISV